MFYYNIEEYESNLSSVKFSMMIAKIYGQFYELLWQEPSGLESDLFLRENTKYAPWKGKALRSKFPLKKFNISLITKYPLT